MNSTGRQEKAPNFGEALAVLLTCIVILVGGILVFGIDTPIVILLSTIVFTVFGVIKGIPYAELQRSMLKAMSSSGQILVMLTLVGALVGAMMAAGTIPYMIDLGLRSIRPSIFLPLAVVFGAIISSSTGSAISSMFTIGVAFMGIAEGLGVPGGITAGAVLCGAYFGDKNSPVSSFAAFDSAVSHVELNKYLKNALYTTIPATVGSIIIFFIMGLRYAGSGMDRGAIAEITGGLGEAFRLSPICLLPLLVMVGLMLLKLPSLPAIALGALTAAVISVAYQGMSIHDAMAVMVNGYRTDSTMEFVVTMANRGGMLSMAYIIICIMLAMCMGGVIGRIGIMEVIVGKLDRLVSNRKSLIISTVGMSFAGHYATAQVIPAALLAANVFEKKYEEQGVDKAVMARSIADGALVSCPIVPWDPDGICAQQAFGLSTAAFAPFYLVMWLTLLMDVISALTGFGVVEHDYRKDPGDRSE